MFRTVGLFDPEELCGRGFCGRARWDAFLAPVRASGSRGGHRGGVQGDDMAAVTYRDAEPVGGHAVPGDHDSARGGDVTKLGPDRMGHHDLGGGQLRRHRVAVTAIRHQLAATPCGPRPGSPDRPSPAPAVAALFWPPPTEDRPSAVARMRVSPRTPAKRSRLAWACSTVASSASVRHQRCAAVWLTFSTTPLRLPRRGGQIATQTP